jgi:hypothetical protein
VTFIAGRNGHDHNDDPVNLVHKQWLRCSIPLPGTGLLIRDVVALGAKWSLLATSGAMTSPRPDGP